MGRHNESDPRDITPEGADNIITSTPAPTKKQEATSDLNAAGRLCGGDIAVLAIEYARHNWPVFRLRGKVPAIPNPHPKGSPEYTSCKGECGLLGHGHIDATTDTATVAAWWSGRYERCNIGARVPASMFVLDVDPWCPYRSGLDTLAELEQEHGPLPATLTDYSGRGDGGAHYFFRRPPGKITGKRFLRTGLDVKTDSGYVVLPPSIHPVTGNPYTRIDQPVAAPPDWLITLLRPDPPKITTPKRSHGVTFSGPSIADQFTASTSWAAILEPHRWRCVGNDPDGDGAVWLHPNATSACSATVRNGCLFVYSTNTVFDVTEPGDPHGYTKFRAYALLDHDGDMSAAARALRGVAR